MNQWKQLNIVQKACIGLFILIVAAFLPELAFFVQLGGTEFALGALAVYFLPVVARCRQFAQKAKAVTAMAVLSYQLSASSQPRVFALQATFCVIAFAMTGSMPIALSLFMPGVLFNHVLV